MMLHLCHALTRCALDSAGLCYRLEATYSLANTPLGSGRSCPHLNLYIKV